MSILDKIIKTALFIEKTAALDVWRVYDRNFVGTVQMNLNSESAIYVVKSTKFSPNKEIAASAVEVRQASRSMIFEQSWDFFL